MNSPGSYLVTYCIRQKKFDYDRVCIAQRYIHKDVQNVQNQKLTVNAFCRTKKNNYPSTILCPLLLRHQPIDELADCAMDAEVDHGVHSRGIGRIQECIVVCRYSFCQPVDLPRLY